MDDLQPLTRALISIELRGPLTVIVAQLQMIRRETACGAATPEWLATRLESIEAASARLVVLAEKVEHVRPAPNALPSESDGSNASSSPAPPPSGGRR